MLLPRGSRVNRAAPRGLAYDAAPPYIVELRTACARRSQAPAPTHRRTRRSPMADLDLLVPGTGGITLMDHTGRDLGYPVKMRLGTASKGMIGMGADAYSELLTMEHDEDRIAPVKTSARPGTSIRPGHVLEVAYNQVPERFNHFLYDWRADIRHSAIQLLELLEERQPADGRWNVVGHSQGALVIVVASHMLAGPEAFSELVRSVVLVGAPLAGTVNSAEALLSGEVSGKPSAPIFREILRTWPSLYQMLPQWPAVVGDDGEPLPDELQLLSPGGWEGVEGFRPDFLDRADEVVHLLRDPLGHMRGDIRVAVVLARNRNTGIALRRSDGTVDPVPVVRQKGDGLVPFERTIGWVGDHIRRFVVAYDGPANPHAFLLCDPGVSSDVLRLVR